MNARDPFEVDLTEKQVQFCRKLAKARDDAKRDGGEMFKEGFSSTDINALGVYGEAAAAKRYGGRIDRGIYPAGDRHRPDVTLPDGRKLEVKAVTHTGLDPHIKWSPDEPIPKWACTVQIMRFLEDGRLLCLVWPILARCEIEPFLFERDYGHGPRRAFSMKDWRLRDV